jgi:hypothetical protein
LVTSAAMLDGQRRNRVLIRNETGIDQLLARGLALSQGLCPRHQKKGDCEGDDGRQFQKESGMEENKRNGNEQAVPVNSLISSIEVVAATKIVQTDPQARLR